MANNGDTKTTLLGLVILVIIVAGVFWIGSMLLSGGKKDTTNDQKATDRSALANISVENTLISTGKDNVYTFQITDTGKPESAGKFCIHLRLSDDKAIDSGCAELQEMADVSTSNNEMKRLINIRSKYAPNTKITQFSYSLSVDGNSIDSDKSLPITDNIKAVN